MMIYCIVYKFANLSIYLYMSIHVFLQSLIYICIHVFIDADGCDVAARPALGGPAYESRAAPSSYSGMGVLPGMGSSAAPPGRGR